MIPATFASSYRMDSLEGMVKDLEFINVNKYLLKRLNAQKPKWQQGG